MPRPEGCPHKALQQRMALNPSSERTAHPATAAEEDTLAVRSTAFLNARASVTPWLLLIASMRSSRLEGNGPPPPAAIRAALAAYRQRLAFK